MLGWRDAVAELVSLQEEYRAWLDSLPDNLAESATAQALRAVCDLDLSELDVIRAQDARRNRPLAQNSPSNRVADCLSGASRV